MHVRPQHQLASLHSHTVHDSWAGYRKAKADERRLITELRYATDAEARAERLYADKAIALQDLQRAHANRVSAEEALDMGRTELRRAEEELEHLGITNGEDPTGESGENIPVRSPFAGVVLERLVTPGTAVTPGTPLFVVSDLSTVWVLAEIDEAHLAGAQTGRPVTVRVAAYTDESFTGRVTYVGETVNPKTRRVTVRCEVPNTNGRLKPEMYATVAIGQSEPRTIVAVPSASVQTVKGQTSVFVEDGAGRFRVRPVELGTDRDGVLEVRRGLRSGERVAVSGAFILKSELLKSSGDGGE
jgi:membrane fusion protein, heavy metal efflux system